MYCSRCGNYIYDNTQVCPYCGNVTAYYNYYNNVPQVSQPVYYVPVNRQLPYQQVLPYQQAQTYQQIQPVSQVQPVQKVQTVRRVQTVQKAKQNQSSQANAYNGVRDNVCAIIGFIFAFFGLFAIAGLICSIIGLSNSKKRIYGYKGGGLSAAGIIISIISILCFIALVIVWVTILEQSGLV